MKNSIIVLCAVALLMPVSAIAAEEATFGGYTCETIRWAASKFSVEEREKWIKEHNIGWKTIVRIKKVCHIS